MKRILPLILCSCLGLMASEGKVFPFPLHKDTLPNGLQVITVPFDSPGLVAYTTLVRVGSRDEVEAGKTGFAHFFEHCMFRGTEKYPTNAYNTMLQKMAVSGNADTWFDRTYYYFTGNADHLESMFDIESDRFQNLKYSQHGFKTEAGAVLGEYTKNFANPSRRLYEAMQEVAFKKHTYGHTTMGFLSDIKDMPNQYDYSLSFYDRFYRPEYCTLIIVGDVTHDKVMSLAKKYYGNWKRGTYTPNIAVEPEQTERRSVHVPFDGDTNYVGVYYKSPAFSDVKKDKIALDFLIDMYFSSRSDIYRELVMEQQKVQFFSQLTWNTRDPFVVGVYASLFNVEDTPAVRKRIEQTFQDILTRPIDGELLEELKTRRRYGMVAYMDRPVNVAEELANWIWLTGDPDTLERYYQLVAEIQPEDLKKAARKYLVDTGRIDVTLSAEERAR